MVAMRVSPGSVPMLLLLLACSSPREHPPSNVAAPTAVRVRPTDPLGAIGLATAPGPGPTEAPIAIVSRAHPVVVPGTERTLPASVAAIGARGGVVRFTAGAPARVPFGCDDHQLDVLPLAGPRLPPGPVWILPPAPPPTWAPAPLAITATTTSTTARGYAVGPLTVELVRDRDPSRGTLTIARAGRPIYSAPFERVLMDGAEPAMATLDLAEPGPGIPAPIAAWSIAAGAPNGPILLVLLRPSWEGYALEAVLVDAASAAPINALSTYLYSCAF